MNQFRMIERHFFRDRCLKTFDFDFGFCMPNSRNTCEHVYELPQFSENDSKIHTHTHTQGIVQYPASPQMSVYRNSAAHEVIHQAITWFMDH